VAKETKFGKGGKSNWKKDHFFKGREGETREGSKLLKEKGSPPIENASLGDRSFGKEVRK